MLFRSEDKSVCADVIPFYENGQFRLFYLKDFRDVKNHGEGCPWCLITTTDLVHFENHGEVIKRGSADEQDLYVFTGCCVKMNGEYRIYYTGHNPHKRAKGLPEQKILLAVSDDGIHFKKRRDFVFEAPEWMEMHDFRDPFVFYDDDKKKYAMLIAGRIKNELPVHYAGGTFIAYSDDGEKWEVDKKPVYMPYSYFTHECPDLFKMGDWWYLVFSEFTDKISTRYVMAKSLDGEWIAPCSDLFDGHAFYAAKSVSDGNRRIIFGWNCIKDNERDDELWQWGGTIIPNEIVQAADGTLGVRCPQEILDNYSKLYNLVTAYEIGKVTRIGIDRFNIGGKADTGILMFKKIPAHCKISLKFKPEGNAGDFGIILNENNNHQSFYKIKFEPKFNRVCLDKMPRQNNALHVNIDTERYCPLLSCENNVNIIVEDTVLEVYINDFVCMSARMFDSKDGNFGLYAHNTVVEFSEIEVKTEKCE